ncbi:UNVERIFIED_CONTAM: hypothetical protein GTU68_057503 [Idotea baltica]|nr:hypothetical protein [Idotea baltica]
MGDVYLGYEADLDRHVAIKVLPQEFARKPDFARRFRQEAAAAAGLSHPNIVQVFFSGQDSGLPFFAMQFVEGESLSELLTRTPVLSVDQTVVLILHALCGLAHAHQQQMVHRDIKPGNLLIDHQLRRALLADFGLVKSMQEANALTATGVVMGTAEYISPEQGQGLLVDHRSDLYSVGVMMYQMLSGSLPFAADSPTAMIYQHVHMQPESLSQVSSDVPESLVRIVDRLLAKSPADRYSSADAVLRDLRAAFAGHPPSSIEVPATAINDYADVPSVRQTVMVHVPDFGAEPLLPETSEPDDSKQNWWSAAKRRVFRVLHSHAPKLVEQLQNTQQQFDGAICEYQDRCRQLQSLVTEAQQVVDQLTRQAGETRVAAADSRKRATRVENDDNKRAAIDEAQRCDVAASELDTLIAEQQDDLESIRLKLAQTDAKVLELESQRDLLNARLGAAQAGISTLLPGRQYRRNTAIALIVACLVIVGFFSVAWFFAFGTSQTILASVEADFQQGHNHHGDGAGTGTWSYASTPNLELLRSNAELTAMGWESSKTIAGHYEFGPNIDERFGYPHIWQQSDGQLSMTPGEQLAVTRWTSGISGTVTISGNFRKWQIAAGDGVAVHVMVNGVKRFGEAIAFNDLTGVDFDVSSRVEPGSTIDFVVGMDGPGSSDDINNDGTVLQAIISQAAGETKTRQLATSGKSPHLPSNVIDHDQHDDVIPIRSPVRSIAIRTALKNDNIKYEIAAGADDGAVTLYRILQSGFVLEKARLTGHRGRVNQIVYSPDGTRLASAGDDGTIRIWQTDGARDRSAWRILTGHKSEVTHVLFSEDGQQMLSAGNRSGGKDTTIRHWDVQTEQELKVFHAKGGGAATIKGLIRSVVSGRTIIGHGLQNPNGFLLAGRELDGNPTGYAIGFGGAAVEVWEEGSLSLPATPTATKKRMLQVRDTASGIRVLDAGDRVEYSAVSNDQLRAVTGGTDQKIRLWELKTGQLVRDFSGHKKRITSIGISRDQQLAVTAAEDGTIRLWHLPPPPPPSGQVREIQAGSAVNCVTVSSDGFYLAFGDSDSTRIWALDARHGKEKYRYDEAAPVSMVRFSADAESLLYATGQINSQANQLAIRHHRTSAGGVGSAGNRVHRQLQGHTDAITCAALNRSGTHAWSGSSDGTIRFWEVLSGEEIGLIDLGSRVNSLAVSTDEQTIYAAVNDKDIRIIDVKQKSIIGFLRGHSFHVLGLGMSANGKRLSSASGDRTVRLWNTDDGHEICVCRGHTDRVNSVSMTETGRFLVSGSDDGTVRFWSVDTVREIRTFTGHAGAVLSVEISPDEVHAISGSADQTVRLWKLPGSSG